MIDVRPTLKTFCQDAQANYWIPLVAEVVCDLETPLGIFQKIDDMRTSFLFESVEGGEKWSRYSFMGVGARTIFRSESATVVIENEHGRVEIPLPESREKDPLDYLRPLLKQIKPIGELGLPRFAVGAIGYLSYDWVRYVERIPCTNPNELGLPECFFVFPKILLIHDRLRQSLSIVHPVKFGPDQSPEDAYNKGLQQINHMLAQINGPIRSTPKSETHGEQLSLRSNFTRDEYRRIVEQSRKYIRAGDIFQVVPSQRFFTRQTVEALEIYRALRLINPSPYLFFMRCPDHIVFGSSPEVLVRLEDTRITLRPIAGTRPRGKNEREDLNNERLLLADKKELAEHLMLVDLGRNDVGRVSEIGSVKVTEFQTIERYSHVMHIVSNVTGTLRSNQDAIDVLRAVFPAGTLTGAPKVRAMEIIDELEPTQRGLYGGSIGYIDARGNMDMCIAIRTLVAKDDMVYLQAGGGVVADSDPDKEYDETLHKAGALVAAIERAAGRRIT